MVKIAILLIFLAFVNIVFSQNSPCYRQTNKLNIQFQKKFEMNDFQQIIEDFGSVTLNHLTKEDQAEIRLYVFYAEIETRDKRFFDFTNYIELLKNICLIEDIDCKIQYVTIIVNTLGQGFSMYPDLAVKLTDILLNNEELFHDERIAKHKYVALANLYNYYTRNNNLRLAEIVKKDIEKITFDNHQKLFALLSDVGSLVGLSYFEAAHIKLKEADLLFLNNEFDGKDSVDFILAWSKFYSKLGDRINQKLYLQIALEIARENDLNSDIQLINFELSLLESDTQKRILFLEDQLTNHEDIFDFKLLFAIMDALALAYLKNNQVDFAIKTWRNLSILEKKYNSKISQFTYWNLAYGYLKNQNLRDASAIAVDAYKLELQDLTEGFYFYSANERRNFLKSKIWYFDFINELTLKSNGSTTSLNNLSFNANLLLKSLLLETSRELDQAITNSSDQEMKAQFTEMKQLRKLFSKMQSEGSTNKEIMERYKTQADSLDKILVNKLGEYAASKRKFEITWKDVQSNLTTSDAAIEFARYYDDKDSLYKYMALVVRPDYEYPKLVNLGEEDAIRTAAQNKDFSKLYTETWKGIDSLLVGVKRVYYSPSGELNNVAFSAICLEEGNELVASNREKNRGVEVGNINTTIKACNTVLMDKYELHQLTTTRYLADGTLKKEKPMQPSLALVGGINFDDVPDQTNEADKEQSNEDFALQANLRNQTASTDGKKRGKRSSSNYGKKMEPLPGTKEEVINIAGLLNTSNWKVQTKSDKKAGEFEFKKELETKAPGVLHIATHGFAFPDEAKKESKLMDMNQTSTYKVSEDPMVRCGLMLGGSNISWTGNPQKMIEQTGDDGILTAAEVANLDLSQTKLVVLSACETGLGKIEGSEGTFGLKRGFKLAGVEQIIVSLWSVPDKETMELMTLFYTDLAQTLNPVISFEKAQKEMRNRYPTEPEKWAGFVLVR